MICQFCGKHEANNRYVINLMGNSQEIFICDECVANFRNAGTLAFDISEPERERITRPEPFAKESAGEDIKMKRRLNQLHKQLSDAIYTERYEEAAALRDQINDIKKEVYINGK